MDFIHKFSPSSSKDNDTTLLLLHETGGNEEALIPLGQHAYKFLIGRIIPRPIAFHWSGDWF